MKTLEKSKKPAAKTIDEVLADLPNPTDAPAYAEMLKRKASLNADREKVRTELDAVTAEMDAAGFHTLNDADAEPMKLAGLNTGAFQKRAELRERRAVLERQLADLTRARELLAPEVEAARRAAVGSVEGEARELVREFVRGVVAKYSAFALALLDLKRLRQAVRKAGLSDGVNVAQPFPIEELLAAGQVGMSSGFKEIVARLATIGFLDRAEAEAIVREFKTHPGYSIA